MALTAADVTDLELTGIDATNESTAVAAGKLVLEALKAGRPVLISENDLAEDVWAEMTAYLKRRGVTVAYDHDAGFPVARAS